MLKTLVLIALVAFVTAEKATFENFKVFRITPKNVHQLRLLNQLESYENSYNFWQGPTFVNKSVDLMVPPSKVPELNEFLDSNQFAHEIYIDDVQKLIDSENPKDRIISGEYDFKSYKSLDQIYEYLETLAKAHPHKLEVIVAGKSYENREIKGVKLSSPGQNKSAVFIESGIHAREWIGPATTTYIINALLTSNDPEIKALAEAYDWYILPSVNPDGYVYSHNKNRMWRKTRSPGDNTYCRGTDPNRNWDYMWMVAGASSNQCAETYAGKKAFSEIEMKTLAQYIESVSDNVFAYISFHSYSQLLLFPYGHTTEHLENYDELYSISSKAAKALAQRYGTFYTYGNIAETIYKASGSSIDYVKGKLKVPLAFTYEFRDTGKHGFILPASQIIPNSEEILDSLVAMFKEAKRIGYPKKQ